MRTYFEEKTYESYFNNELDRQCEIYFPFGQVQEGNFGIDSSAFSNNDLLWRKLGYPFLGWPLFSGVNLREIADEMEHYLGYILDHIPIMKANLIFQYKKPEYITIKFGKEWKHWKKPYYRYDIYKEQHELLIHIHSKFSSKILIIYASPAIHDINELIKLRHQLLDHSNFTKAQDLIGHNRNTYINAGTHSIACSDPKNIEKFNLIEELKFISKENSNNEKLNNRAFIKNYSNQISSIISENQFFSESFKSLNDSISKVKEFELFHSFLTMINFRQLTGTQWLVKL